MSVIFCNFAPDFETNTQNFMETIAKIKTPKGEWKVVKRSTAWYRDVYQIWTSGRHRLWRIYETEDEAVKAMIEMAAAGYLMKSLFNQE